MFVLRSINRNRRLRIRRLRVRLHHVRKSDNLRVKYLGVARALQPLYDHHGGGAGGWGGPGRDRLVAGSLAVFPG